MTPIETAVAPLKADAIKKAEGVARQTIDKILADLAAAGWDADKVAPYPRAFGKGALGGQDYKSAHRRYKLLHSLTKGVEVSHQPGKPYLVTRSIPMEDRFIALTREQAAAQYDLFVMKLDRKIGAVTEAVLTGSHVWGYSFLRVVKEDGTKETWKTQQIVNVSSLGTIFNQWPSRKVKN